MDISDELFDIANKDLEAAEVLYARGLYPQAIFSLQQSIEKASKSLFVKVGAAESTDLENFISHNPIEIIELLSKKEKEIQKENEKLMEKIPELKESEFFKKDLNKEPDLEIKKKEELTKISFDINSSEKKFVEKISVIKNLINAAVMNIDYLKKNGIKGFIDEKHLKEFIRLFQLVSKKYPLIVKTKRFEDRNEILKLLQIFLHFFYLLYPLFLSLLLLSLITLIGAVYSRYPDIPKDSIPKNLFDSNSPIIRNFYDVVYVYKCNLKFIEALFEGMKEMKKYYGG
jgi:HEPN domain-containing protein